MLIRTLSLESDLAAYDAWVKRHPQGSLWQSLEWKRFQEALGREMRVYAAMEGQEIQASALVVIDRTAFGLTTWDVPRGPLGEWPEISGQQSADKLLTTITEDAKQAHCLSLFLSPTTHLTTDHWPLATSSRHEQPQATRLIDLQASEEEILTQMHQKGRYNIKVAQKHGIRVKQSEDSEAFYGLMRKTGERDAFGILPKRHYETFLKELPGSFLLLAYAKLPSPGTGEGSGVGAVAALLGVVWGTQSIYYYGASNHAHRALMAPYLLQWEAMKRCKATGCRSYDLLGIAPPIEAQTTTNNHKQHTLPLSRQASGKGGEGVKPRGGHAPLRGAGRRGHPWAGVSAFKEKFGGTVVSYPSEQQIVLRPVVNALLGLKRKILG